MGYREPLENECKNLQISEFKIDKCGFWEVFKTALAAF
jgi:hypothetical protein